MVLHCQLGLPTLAVSHLLLLLNASMPSTALDASVISDKGRIEVTGASVPTLSAGLLQHYTIAGIADTVVKGLQSVQNTAARLVSGTIFRVHYHYFTQPPVASDVAKNHFQEHSPVSIYELCIQPVKNCRNCPWLQDQLDIKCQKYRY